MDDTPQTPVAETPAATVETPAAEAVATAPVAVPAPSDATATVPSNPESAETAQGPMDVNPWMIVGVVAVVVILVGVLLRPKRGGKGSSPKGQGDSPKGNGDVVEIYVGNLSYDMTEAQFRKEFERFGVVKSARIIGHRTSGKSKGYGFVEMPHRKEALVAIKALNNREVMGRKLRVNEARNGTGPRE